MLSIVIPAYNAAKTISEALDSIPSAVSTPYEIIICDDGSVDETVAVVKKHALAAKCKILQQPNSGPSTARNNGILAASGEFVICLDADDRLTPHALDRLSALLVSNPTAVAAYGSFANIGANSKRTGLRHKLLAMIPRPEGDCLEPMLRANFIINPGIVLIRRSLVVSKPLFNTSIRLSEDWEFWVRLSMLGPILFLRGEPTLEFRRHAASTTATATTMLPQMLETIDIVFNNPDVIKRIEAGKLKSLYATRVAHVYLIYAQREWRNGAKLSALKHFVKCLGIAPRRIPINTLRFAARAAGVT